MRTRVRAWREGTISLSFSGLGAHAYVRTYVRMCLRAHVRRFLPNASNQTPARIPVNAAAGRRKGAEIDRRKGAVRERELVRELRGEMSIGERGASLCEP